MKNSLLITSFAFACLLQTKPALASEHVEKAKAIVGSIFNSAKDAATIEAENLKNKAEAAALELKNKAEAAALELKNKAELEIKNKAEKEARKTFCMNACTAQTCKVKELQEICLGGILNCESESSGPCKSNNANPKTSDELKKENLSNLNHGVCNVAKPALTKFVTPLLSKITETTSEGFPAKLTTVMSELQTKMEAFCKKD